MKIFQLPKSILLLSLFLVFTGLNLSSESGSPIIRDPGFIHGEESRYIIRSGDEVSYSRTVINRIVRDERLYYEITSFNENGERTLILDSQALIPMETYSLNRNGDSEYSSSTKVNTHPRIAANEVFLIGLEDLSVILRGYPFQNPQSLQIKILGQGGDDSGFSLSVEYRKQERLELPGGNFTAHKLEVVTRLPGAMSIFRGAIPKNYLWFNSQAPHQLLKREGAGGFGSGETQISELVDFQN